MTKAATDLSAVRGSVREPKLKVDLATTTSPAVSSRLSAWVDDQGLVLEGQDVGPGVASIWGDSDYEYWLSVDRTHFREIINGLQGQLGRPAPEAESGDDRDQHLLDLLKECWTTGVFDTDVDFRRWLDAIKVPSDFSSYA